MIIDRFEGDDAICEDKSQRMITIKRKQLPIDAREGSEILYENGNFILKDNASERKRLQEKNAGTFSKKNQIKNKRDSNFSNL